MAEHWFMILGHSPMLLLLAPEESLPEGAAFKEVPKQLLSCPRLISKEDLCSANMSCTTARVRESIVL